MQEIKKTIRQLVKSLWKARKGLRFVHDIKVLNSSYDVDYEDRALQKEVWEELKSLRQQRKIIKDASDHIIAKIDEAIEQIGHFLQ